MCKICFSISLYGLNIDVRPLKHKWNMCKYDARFIMDEFFSSYVYVFHTCLDIWHLCQNNMNLWQNNFSWLLSCTTMLAPTIIIVYAHTHHKWKNHTNGTFRVCKFAWTLLCYFSLYSWLFHLCKLFFSFVLCFFCLLFLVLLLDCVTCSL